MKPLILIVVSLVIFTNTAFAYYDSVDSRSYQMGEQDSQDSGSSSESHPWRGVF